MRREVGVAIWVGPKAKVPKVERAEGRRSPESAQRTREKWGIQKLSDARHHRAPRRTRYGMGMDITWLGEESGTRAIDRIAVGGGIWNSSGNMADLKKRGITHIIDMQIECDDTELGSEHGMEVLWNPTDDDFEPKEPELFHRGVEFALKALEKTDTKLFIHCAAGVHRAPMMTLAVLRSMGWTLEDAWHLIEDKRPVADFADVYVESVERFVRESERLKSPR